MSNIPRVVGEGTYGCVLKPSLKCKGKKNISYENKVSKVISKSNAKDELKEYDNVDRADKNGDFYLGKPESCNIDEKLVSNTNAIQQCKIGNSVLQKLSAHKLILMGDGGINIVTYAESVKEWAKSSANTRRCDIFALEALRLFAGLIKFKEHGLIHHDLKPQNIVYNEEKERLNFIDFGVMQDKPKSIAAARRSGFRFSIFHWSYPWECQFLDMRSFTHLKSKNSSQRAATIDKDVNDFVNRTQTRTAQHWHWFFGYALDPNMPNRDEYRLLRSVYFKDYRNFLGSSFDYMPYDAFVEKCLDTVDVYGLGFTLMHWLIHSEKHLDSDFAAKIYALFYQMLTPDLNARLLIEQATAQYEHILIESGLLEKHKKEIQNHIVVDAGKPRKPDIMKQLDKAGVDLPPPPEIAELEPGEDPCPDGKERNPKTRRCINTCKPGYSRDENFNCKKNKTAKMAPIKNEACRDDQERNPKTGRCVKLCKPGYSRDANFNCKKNKTIKNKFIKELKRCNDDQERNPKTERCVKLCKPGYSRDADFKCVKSR